jgi:ribosome maturation factor RimP
MPLKEEITSLVTTALEGKPLFIVDVSVKGENARPKIAVILDGDQGITIDECARISRLVGDQIEARDLVPQAYTLEVSSPGLDQPLRLPRQYNRHQGRNVKVHLRDGSLRTGKLLAAGETDITLAEEVKGKKKGATPPEVTIPLADIEKTFVLVSFSQGGT